MAKKRKLFSSKKIPTSLLAALCLIMAIGLIVVYAYQQTANQILVANNENQSDSNQVTQDFIEEISASASLIAQKNDLYASVMIAQAILESNSGQSVLSNSPAYNLFGIKGDYQGNSVVMQTWEDDGSGQTYTIDAQFRAYPSRSASLEDYAALLDKDIYQSVHKSQTSSYTDATAALTGTYATDTSYGSKLNSIIERYGLLIYDTP
ncbi:glucosaminidase domain-containing protein [Streptococcus loxodontisalivarius]|uniref:Flagellum-specific peptidoglycan hydrolase FlgJ n=1 Tax=Streptococcus loxodontisalivarius TaxID=1349415 RepID=A0ABS2PT24_9STRE|nr:flagellum-specific peptidoglycan hydrolase FlgJ [Streptococcus loxodontisalivarius]